MLLVAFRTDTGDFGFSITTGSLDLMGFDTKASSSSESSSSWLIRGSLLGSRRAGAFLNRLNLLMVVRN